MWKVKHSPAAGTNLGRTGRDCLERGIGQKCPSSLLRPCDASSGWDNARAQGPSPGKVRRAHPPLRNTRGGKAPREPRWMWPAPAVGGGPREASRLRGQRLCSRHFLIHQRLSKHFPLGQFPKTLQQRCRLIKWKLATRKMLSWGGDGSKSGKVYEGLERAEPTTYQRCFSVTRGPCSWAALGPQELRPAEC